MECPLTAVMQCVAFVLLQYVMVVLVQYPNVLFRTFTSVCIDATGLAPVTSEWLSTMPSVCFGATTSEQGLLKFHTEVEILYHHVIKTHLVIIIIYTFNN